ncbi:DUF4258 domain-containing protein [Candidatus Sumerlaeota bacterium]|nr:DUF4258 domain-containing protein [Candidatus Sumerlaeota bacterium]
MELAKAVVTDHALVQMARRAIDEKTLRAVLAQPENVEHVRPGRVVAQAPDGEYLLRVFVDVDRDPPEVVTAYKTSKMGKYRRLQ